MPVSSKPFTVLSCEQRSPEWFAARCGVFTASRAGDVFETTAKGAWTAKRKNYRTELCIERTTGKPKDDNGWKGKTVQDGVRRESGSLRAYENIHGVMLRSVGFVLDNELPIGCSPDGVIGDFEGLVSAKNPLQATHFETLRLWHAVQSCLDGTVTSEMARKLYLGCVPPEYASQIRHELYVTGASWCDYVSYHEDFPEHLRGVTIRALASDIDLSAYANDVKTFLQEVDAECEQIASWR